MLDFLLLYYLLLSLFAPITQPQQNTPILFPHFFQKNVCRQWKALHKREKQRKKGVTEKQEKGVPRGKIPRSTAVCHNKNMQSATSLVPIKNQYSDNPTVTAGRKRF